MSPNLFVSLGINGLTMGMVYAMIAMGLILLIRAVGVLNFAQGDLVMVGAYISCFLLNDLKLPIGIMIPIALIVFAVLGLLFMLTTYWPLRKASYPVAPIIATMGASLVLSEGTIIIFGSWPKTLAPVLRSAEGTPKIFEIFGVRIQAQFILTIVVAIVSMLLVHILFDKSYIGKMMQATSYDKPAAELIGISTLFTVAVTYILDVGLVSLAGFMVAPIYSVTPSLSSLQLRAFAGTVIGGFGSIKGAVIGCIIVGLVEGFASVNFSSYKDAVVFLVLILFLAIRPKGLVVSKVGDKA